MTKRLGKRERAKLRKMKTDQSAHIALNMKSEPERSFLPDSTSSRNGLLARSHTPGFQEPRGGLAKSRVERAHIPTMGYEVRLDGVRLFGANNKRQAKELAAHYRERVFIETGKMVRPVIVRLDSK